MSQSVDNTRVYLEDVDTGPTACSLLPGCVCSVICQLPAPDAMPPPSSGNSEPTLVACVKVFILVAGKEMNMWSLLTKPEMQH